MKLFKPIILFLLLAAQARGQSACSPCFDVHESTRLYNGACPGSTLTLNPVLTGTHEPGATFKWTGPLTFSSPTSLSTTVTVPTVTTVVTLTVTADCNAFCGSTFPATDNATTGGPNCFNKGGYAYGPPGGGIFPPSSSEFILVKPSVAAVMAEGMGAPCDATWTGDHTPGDNFLFVNGSTNAANSFYSQRPATCPGRQYTLSYWARPWGINWTPWNAPGDQTAISVNYFGTISSTPDAVNPPLPLDYINICMTSWKQYTALPYTAINGYTRVELRDLSTAVPGNDFAMDDIKFITTFTWDYQVTINPVPAPAPVVTNTANACVGSAYTFTVTGTSGDIINYVVTKGTTTLTTGSTTVPSWSTEATVPVPVLTSTGNLCIRITSVNRSGCVFNFTPPIQKCIPITNAPGPLTVTIAPNPRCTGQTVGAVAFSSGATNYTWSASAGSLSSTTGSIITITTPSSPGVMAITCTASNACGTATPVTKTYTINPSPAAAPTYSPTCVTEGDVVTLNANASGPGAPYTYSWAGIPMPSPSTSATPTVTAVSWSTAPPLSATMPYVVTVTNTFACTNTKPLTVTVHKKPKAGKIKGDERICAGGQGKYSVNGGTGYPGAWDLDPNGTASTIDGVTGILTTDPDVHDYTTITVLYIETNPCGRRDTATFPVVIIPHPTFTVTPVNACLPICPGEAVQLQVCGTPPGASFTYSTSLPGIPDAAVMLPPTPPSCTTFVSDPAAAGIYTFNITSSYLEKCQWRENIVDTIHVRKPICNMTLHGPISPCMGADFQLEISGDPGVYTVQPQYAPAFTVTVTATGYVLSPTFTMPGFAPGVRMVEGMMTFCVTKIVSPCGCINEPREGEPFPCCFTVYSRPQPAFYLSNATACAGYPFTMYGHASPIPVPVDVWTWHPGTDFPGGGGPGVSSQILTISTPGTYTYSVTGTSTVTGCSYSTTLNVTVSLVPDPIFGPDHVCVGDNITLTDATPGGSWQSVVEARATVDPVSGVVTGIAPGTTTIRYMMPSGCSNFLVVTVDPMPYPIDGGTDMLCGPLGSTTTFVNGSPGGGTWSCSPATIASISASGELTLLGSGTANITFTSTAGCARVRTVTLDVVPAIVGPTTICDYGPTATYTHPTPGGSWSSSDESVVYIDPLTGDAYTLAPGSAVITYHLPTGDCDPTLTVNVITEDGACVAIHWDPVTTHNFWRISGWPLGATVYFSFLGEDPVNCFCGTPTCSVTLTGGTAPGPYYVDLPIADMSVTPPCYIPYIQLDLISMGTCSVPLSCYATLRPATGGGQDEVEVGTVKAKVSKLQILPNPNSGDFRIKGSIPATASRDEVSIEVVDAIGRTVYEKRVRAAMGMLDTPIQLNEALPAGIYMARIKNRSMNEVIKFTVDR